jgi:hypothetical protein
MSGQRIDHWRPVGSRLKRRISILVVVALAFAVSACGGNAEPQIKYEPPLLPVRLVVAADEIAVEGDSPDLVTPIGTFSIGAKYELEAVQNDQIYIVLRDRNRGRSGSDDIFRLTTGEDVFNVVVDGTTEIEVKDRRVLIDITDGTIKVIAFKRAQASGAEARKSSGFPWWDDRVASWDEGWKSSFYRPFALSRWAYDDSTISKWYGIGFVWFLLRLFIALILGVVDLLLTLVFLVAQAAYMSAGSTGRNIVWGLSVLLLPVMILVYRFLLE